MILGVPKETKEREKRVSLSPDVVKSLAAAGYSCLIEKGAGLNSYFTDEA